VLKSDWRLVVRLAGRVRERRQSPAFGRSQDTHHLVRANLAGHHLCYGVTAAGDKHAAARSRNRCLARSVMLRVMLFQPTTTR